MNTHTHTHHEHTPGAVGSHLCFGARGAVGGFSTLLKGTSVVVLKVGGGSTVHSLPHLQFLPARDSNSQPFDYKSDPPLGHDFPMYAEIFQELTQHKVQHPQINCKNKKDAMHLLLWCIRYIEWSPFCQSVLLHNMEETVSVTLPLLLDKLRNKEDEDEPLGCLHLLPTAGRGNENHFNRCAPFHGQKGIRENIRHCFYVLFNFKVMCKMG